MTDNAFNWDVLDSDDESRDGEEHVLLPIQSRSPNRRKQNDEHEVASDLTFRQPRSVFSKREEDLKYRYAILSILIGGITLILIVTIGLGIHDKQNDVHSITSGLNQHDTNIGAVTKPLPVGETFCDEKGFPWKDYRLPEDIIPHLYDIHLKPNINAGNYTGNIKVHITVIKESKTIILHSSHHTILNVTILDKDGKKDKVENAIEKISYCKKHSLVALQLKSTLNSNQKYIIDIDFSASFRIDMAGFYLSSYLTKNGSNVTIATTQFEATDARSAFPCFDEPSFKANFTLMMTHDGKRNILFNTPLLSSKTIEGGLVESKFETTPSMSTYLVAIVMSNFAAKSKNVSSTISGKNILISVYSEPEKVNQTDYALSVACEILIYYENLFKVPYPLKKLDLVAIPDFEAGAMENWGLITYRETALLLDVGSSDDNKRWVTTVIAHEVSHQWFGNLVTMEWWNELWLNEGFASYMELKGVNKTLPEWNIMDIFCTLKPERAMTFDESALSHPITFHVQTKSEIGQMFDNISYEKGATLISMLIEYVGSTVFFDAISNYLQKYAYQNTVHSNLIKEINELYKNDNINIENIFDSWISQPGFPIIKVSKTGNNQLSLEQMHFHAYGSSSDFDDLKWNIPISYVTSEAPQTSHTYYLHESSDSITLAKSYDWVKLNHNRNGYYVVHYEDDLFDLLVDQLTKNHSKMTSRDRSDVIFSSFMSAKADLRSYSSVFDMLKYLKNETDYLSLYDASKFLKQIRKILSLQLDLSEHKLRSYMIDLFKPSYNQLAWKDESKLTFLQVKAKNLLEKLMCGLNDDNCRVKAMSIFNSWKQNKTKIMANQKYAVLRTAIQFGPDSNWEYVWDMYKNNHTLTDGDKEIMLKCLCHGNNQVNLQTILLAVLEGKTIKTQHMGLVFKSMTKTNTGYFVVSRFYYQHYDHIMEKITEESFIARKIATKLTDCITQDYELEQFTSLLTSKGHEEIRSNKLIIENTKVRLAWIKHFQTDVVKWLNTPHT